MSSRHLTSWIDDPAPDEGLFIAGDEDGGNYLSFVEFAEMSLRVAGFLVETGVQPGDNVCILVPTSHLGIATIYAVWASGGTVTLIAPPFFGMDAAYASTVSEIVRQVSPSVVVASPELATAVAQIVELAGAPTRVVALHHDVVDRVAAIDGPRGLAECALVQFTSGSAGNPRGVMVSWDNLAANVNAITALIDFRPGDASVSWLPLYHDMGLISLLMGVANQGPLHQMRPDHFIRDPSRWLRAMSGAHHAVSPSFGLAYTARRLRPDDVADLDLSSWRSLVTGAEPVDLAACHAFCRLLQPVGFNSSALIAAYGLAESTLLVSGTAAKDPIAAVRVDKSTLRVGQRVRVLETAQFEGQALSGPGWMAGLGSAGGTVEIVGEGGEPLPDNALGEVVVSSPSVAMGYWGQGTTGTASTRFADPGVLYTGDAGFFHDGQLYVLGRMGSALKVRGKSVFMEDVETRLAAVTGLPVGKLCAVAQTGLDVPGVAVFVETGMGSWAELVRQELRSDLGPAANVQIVVGPRGFIRRTSSGKPRREIMWKLFMAGDLSDGVVVEESAIGATTHHGLPARDDLTGVQALLAKVLEMVEIADGATILLEGSLAEGFGNDASDVDLLAVVPGDEKTPTMPTLLFVDGRRTEIRTRSVGQLRTQLETARAVFADPAAELLTRPGNDLLNRCQRFLRAAVLSPGSRVDEVRELQSAIPYSEFGEWMSRWWLTRARQSLRQAVASATLGVRPDAMAWARDGLQQAAKGWIAGRGEAYLETKWLAMQFERAGDDATVARYWELDAALSGTADEPPAEVLDEADVLDQVVALARQFGVTGVGNDPDAVRFARAAKVTSWPIGDTVHVVRDGQDVFVLTGPGKRAWRSVVFRRPVREAAEHSGLGDQLAEFVRLGLVALTWSDGSAMTPAIAMCDAATPYTCPPYRQTPLVTISGAGTDRPIALSPLSAQRFIEAGGNLIWANVVLENAREDLLGAVRAGQWPVANVVATRLINASIRILASAWGCAPMPPDLAHVATVERLLPEGTDGGASLLAALRTALAISFGRPRDSSDDASVKLAQLDELVSQVRTITESPFPPSMDSREQWRATLDLGYQWLRMMGYLDAKVPLDEMRDLLAAGGNQPHVKGAQ